jgi:hypothetical protein
MRWSILACTGAAYVLLLLGLAELQVSAGGERHTRTIARMDKEVYVKQILLENRYVYP